MVPACCSDVFEGFSYLENHQSCLFHECLEQQRCPGPTEQNRTKCSRVGWMKPAVNNRFIQQWTNEWIVDERCYFLTITLLKIEKSKEHAEVQISLPPKWSSEDAGRPWPTADGCWLADRIPLQETWVTRRDGVRLLPQLCSPAGAWTHILPQPMASSEKDACSNQVGN